LRSLSVHKCSFTRLTIPALLEKLVLDDGDGVVVELDATGPAAAAAPVSMLRRLTLARTGLAAFPPTPFLSRVQCRGAVRIGR
jgi:hypothetical protein